MHIIDLPLDAVYSVIALLSQRELSLLSKTCRCLHHVSCAQLAKRPLVKYTDLPSFHHWLRIGEEDSRAYLLQRLVLLGCEESEDMWPAAIYTQGPLITQILDNCLNLVYLSADDVAAVLSSHRLRRALISLPRLQTLRLTGASRKYGKVLIATLGSLRVADISYGPRQYTDDGCLCRYNPSFLRTHQHTLESLRLDNVRFLAYTVVSFTALRKLDLQSVWLSEGAGSLIPLFPNLQELTLFDLHYKNPGRNSWGNPARVSGFEFADIDHAVNLRTVSRTWQATHKSWEGLRELHVGTLLNLYSLGLCCPVQTVRILDGSILSILEDAMMVMDGESAQALSTIVPSVLADIQPRCLVLHIPLNGNPKIIPVLLAPLGASPCVTHLTISFSPAMLLEISLADVLVSATRCLPAFTWRSEYYLCRRTSASFCSTQRSLR